MDKDLVLSRIRRRKKELDDVSKKLKEKFIGIDNIIDSVIANIKVWYIMPELITRPVIINLWGMTGVGKTDLVRTLVNHLNFNDRFVEFQMSNAGSGYKNSIRFTLGESSIELDSPGIVLFDEIQRFRTVSESGEDIAETKNDDIWMLLSDGKFNSDVTIKEDIMEVILSQSYWAEEEEDDEELAEDEEERKYIQKLKKRKKKRKYHQGYFPASRLKKLLKLKEPISEIMTWNESVWLKKAQERLKSQETYAGESYSKLLIFISGNLDEAYSMADKTENADIDADVFHDFSSKINLVSIKSALNRRFKPEQISRLGNTHIIYPSLNSASYRAIIKQKVNNIVKEIKQKHGISVKINKSVYDCIYRNGVFPAQGVRPVLSTIASMLENTIPDFLFIAIENDIKNISIKYSRNHFIAKVGDKELKVKVEGDIDKIKKKNNIDRRAWVSVHEAAHALVYAIEFKTVPTQVVSNVSLNDLGGYVGCHGTVNSKEYILKNIRVGLAGMEGEKLVFGKNKTTGGSSSDLSEVTTSVAKMLRRYGMGENVSVKSTEYSDEFNQYNLDIDDTNSAIEKILKNEQEKVVKILKDNKDFYIDLVDKLIECGTVPNTTFKNIAKKYGLELNILSNKETIYHNYLDKFREFQGE